MKTYCESCTRNTKSWNSKPMKIKTIRSMIASSFPICGHKKPNFVTFSHNQATGCVLEIFFFEFFIKTFL